MSLESAALRASAQRWMVVCLEQYVVGEDLDFAVHHVCVGTEHLMKAYLSSRHPALVVEGGNFDSLLHATGLGDNALAAYPKLMINGVWLAPQAIEYALNSAT